MKTSTLIMSLLFFNSSLIIAQFMSWLFAYINPFAMIGGELFLVFSYYIYKIIKDVRDVFDVDFKL